MYVFGIDIPLTLVLLTIITLQAIIIYQAYRLSKVTP